MKKKVLSCLLFVVLVLSACSSGEPKEFLFEEVKNEQVDHIHGVGYINGGNDLVIATHTGLYSHTDDGWKEANSQKHDYMGFSAVRDGFFSSGHPEEGSDLKNPLGLIKSTGKGASFEQLAFYGEIDFHYLAAGYDSNAIYVFNEMPTENLNGGLQYSIDQGKTWTQATMNGFKSTNISNFAPHPSREELLVVGSKDGLYISEDYGQNLEVLNNAEMITYVTLNETGGYYTNFDSANVYLNSFSFESKEEKEIQLPSEMMQDPIIYIVTNPNNQNEIAIVTNNLNIYLTTDEGLSWDKIATNGKLSSK
ncbi:photosystem II stability/assembly factor-like uncharacterized protein [Lysinibacillus composti]|uniref:Sialidase n=1 Tax=Lysinibacillus composti TaxID=720633 RepID=A0A3N9UJI6_9BACI|nr:sialidase [Lysinibacillus composti]MBM7607287.1 photosystem II stability/assembly factor-like uncharacterized protein [Lysinibacillus composti]RQW76140.1 sialidase [Lysinibacillus composti]